MSKKQAAFCLLPYSPREASYGAGVDNAYIAVVFKTDELVVLEAQGEEITDEEEIKGFVGISADGVSEKRKEARLTIITKPNTQLLGLALAGIFSDITSLPTGELFQHTFDPSPAMTGELGNPYSFSVITGENANDTATFRKHNGCVVESCRIEWSVDKPEGQMTIVLATDGSTVSAASVTPPSPGDYLAGERITLDMLTLVLNGAAITGLRSLTLELKSDPVADVDGASLPNVGEMFYGANAPSFSAEIVVRGSEGDAVWSAWNDGEDVEFDLSATSYVHSHIVEMSWDHGHIPRASGKIADIENGVVPVLRFTAVPGGQPDTSYLFRVTNDVSGYLDTV